MICKRCQTELPAGERFCPTCGALQPMICPHCGAESRPGSKTCGSCGKKLPLVDRPDKLVYTKRKRRMGEMVAIFAMSLGALMLLGGAIYFLSQTVDFSATLKENTVKVEQIEPEETEVPEETVPVEETPVVEETPAEEEAPAEEETPAEEEAPAEEETPAEEEQPAEEEPTEEEPAEEAPAEEAPAAKGEWMFPDSSERLLTDADIEGLSSWELKVARNEIYARHGRRFNSAELQNHFNSCSWYNGTVAPENFSDTMLSDIELANVQFLKAAE